MTIYTLSGTDSDLSRADPVLPRYRPQNTYRLCQVPHTKRVIKYKHLGLLSFFFFNGDDMCLKLSCLKREILFYNHLKLVLVTVYSKSLILLPLLPTNNLQVLKQKLMFVPFGNNSLFGKTVSQIPYFEQVPNSGIKSREHQTFHTISFRINLLKK